MAKTMKLKILTPDAVYYRDEVLSFIVDEPGGKEGFLPNHEPVMKMLSDGIVQICEKDGNIRKIQIASGYLVFSDEILIFTPEAGENHA